MSSILTARLVGGYTEQGPKSSQAYNAVVFDVVCSVVGLLTKPNSKLCMAKQSMPEVHGLVGFPALKSTGALLSLPTQPILELLVTKDVCLIDIICSLHVHEAYVNIQRSGLHV